MQPLTVLTICLGAFTVLTLGRSLLPAMTTRFARPERWIAVGASEWARELEAVVSRFPRASVVATVDPSREKLGTNRLGMLDLVTRKRADRVVMSSQASAGRGLPDAIAAIKALGIPVSLLAGPPQLVGDPGVTPTRIAGLPALDVGAISVSAAAPVGAKPAAPAPRERLDTGRRLPALTGRPRVSVVMPTCNEARNLPHVLAALPRDLHELILVDGSSSDGTVEVARAHWPEVRVVRQRGRGKGDALRAGFAAVSGDIVVTLDADGSADPREIRRFVEALRSADFAKGSRFLDGGGSDDITALRRFGNRVLGGMANALYGTSYTDLCYGYNAFWADCLPFISLDRDGFEVETVMNLRAAASGLKVAEVPSHEARRIHGETHLRTFRDGTRVLGTIVGEWRPALRLGRASAPAARGGEREIPTTGRLERSDRFRLPAIQPLVHRTARNGAAPAEHVTS